MRVVVVEGVAVKTVGDDEVVLGVQGGSETSHGEVTGADVVVRTFPGRIERILELNNGAGACLMPNDGEQPGVGESDGGFASHGNDLGACGCRAAYETDDNQFETRFRNPRCHSRASRIR